MLVTDAILPDGRVRDVRVRDGTIAAVESGLDAESDERTVAAGGRRLFPGAIDVHVHFRQPGYGHKETWGSGSASAAAGGVTTVVDQPNTDPPTVTGDAFDEKAALAGESVVDWGVNGGVTADWDPDSLFSRDLFALGEVFLADSTGDMGIEADLFADAAERAADEDVVVSVHAEDAALFDEDAHARAADDDGVGRDADADNWSAYRTAEAEAAAVERAGEVGQEVGASIHVAHTSTPEGVDAAADAGATCEVSPHHLLLSRNDLDDLGTYGRMNPPVRSERRRREVYERVANGTVDVVATDHAPHTRAEKEARLLDAPSGVPGVETMLPLLLEEARQDRLGYQRIRDLVAANPARIFDLSAKGHIAEGNDADLVLFDPDASTEIRGDDLHSNCGWTPFEGRQAVFPDLTLVRGQVAFDRDGELGDAGVGDASGRNVRR
jgi:dihydroorotase